ncbi:hypothetical protein NCAS_0D02750 [Naumovozyma castellii]|uniref:Nucleoporin POM34 n=1 Tax=Naumovozyma castellii TaxID=27288 RepID=G0VE65_NAUCA|nr:hypothetical protein NCAS_0D02750 [Naumovozyma castellii CBS 4309]CCC69856.1 hypothetical protein NCAS_0D02750 [Naumovozyma castellii CBS 4309]
MFPSTPFKGTLLSPSRRTDSPGTRQLSEKEFTSLRSQVLRELPRYYEKNQNLPSTGSRDFLSPASNEFDRRAEIQPNEETADSNPHQSLQDGFKKFLIGDPKSLLHNGGTNGKNSQECGELKELSTEENEILTPSNNFGNFESPVLVNLLQRSVSKEQETQTIIANLVFFFVWNLIVKFVGLYFKHTTNGRMVLLKINKKLWSLGWLTKLFNNSYFRSMFLWITWDHVEHLVHIIVALNVIISIWKLFTKVKTNDLNLTPKQKTLLGIDDEMSKMNLPTRLVGISSDNKRRIEKPHVILGSSNVSNELVKGSNSDRSQKVSQPMPYLFKSLKTPSQIKNQRKEYDQKSNVKNGSNLFGSVQPTESGYSGLQGIHPMNITRATNLNTTETSKSIGYVPSNRYKYKMESPSPMKRRN